MGPGKGQDYDYDALLCQALATDEYNQVNKYNSSDKEPNTISDPFGGEDIREEVPENNIFKIPDFPEHRPSNTIGDLILDEAISEEVPENNIFKGEIETYPNIGVKVTAGENGPSVGVYLPSGFKYEENEDGAAKWQASIGYGNVQFNTGPIPLSGEESPEPKEGFLD
jgi:hypothetical protein